MVDQPQRDRPEVEVTPTMIEAGVAALTEHCPMDLAFRVGGEETAVEAVLRAALSLSPRSAER